LITLGGRFADVLIRCAPLAPEHWTVGFDEFASYGGEELAGTTVVGFASPWSGGTCIGAFVGPTSSTNAGVDEIGGDGVGSDGAGETAGLRTDTAQLMRARMKRSKAQAQHHSQIRALAVGTDVTLGFGGACTEEPGTAASTLVARVAGARTTSNASVDG